MSFLLYRLSIFHMGGKGIGSMLYCLISLSRIFRDPFTYETGSERFPIRLRKIGGKFEGIASQILGNVQLSMNARSLTRRTIGA
jgi:hypothetical protein